MTDRGRRTEPVFIGGADRSGTTLAFALLASHPNISMVRRTNMWRWFDGRFGDLAEPANLEAAIDALRRYRRLDQLDPDWDRVRRDVADGPPTYARLFDSMHRQRAERLGRARWGDKSLHTECYADAVFRAFPEARIIHMVRDPRDRHLSITKRYDDRNKGMGAATGRWLNSVRVGERNRRRYPRRYRIVRYEDLAARPEEVTADLCRFIGEDFDPEMLAMRGAPEHDHGNSSHEPMAAGTISTRSIGRYRDALSEEQIAFIQVAAGRAMRRHGYTLDAVRLAGPDRWNFRLHTAPRDLGRMGAWMARERYDRDRATVPTARLGEVAS